MGDSDLQLLAREARAGDARAVDRLLQRLGHEAYRTAWRVLGEESAAADAMQETLVKVVRALPRLDLARPLLPWLRAVAARTALDAWRRDRRRRDVPLDDETRITGPETDRPDRRWEARRAGDDLDAMLAGLPGRQRAVLVMRDLDGVAVADIAAALNMAESTVRVHLARARNRIRALMRRRERNEVLP